MFSTINFPCSIQFLHCIMKVFSTNQIQLLFELYGVTITFFSTEAPYRNQVGFRDAFIPIQDSLLYWPPFPMYLSEWQWICENGFAISFWAPRPKFNFTSTRDLFTWVSPSAVTRCKSQSSVRLSHLACWLVQWRETINQHRHIFIYHADFANGVPSTEKAVNITVTCVWSFLQRIRKIN